MPVSLDPDQFLPLTRIHPVVDVRSPGEFEKGHIPGAVNIPLFDNEERARVGTTYVQVGPGPALEEGKAIANAKLDYYMDRLTRSVSEKCILLHCWRGGLRSAGMAEYYESRGYKVFLLKGGYKAYRQFIRSSFAGPSEFFVLGGYTGSGKTEILQYIRNKGCQVIDLEALASHKGSVFGHLGQSVQPTSEQFENDLYLEWSGLDLTQPVWVEHESISIGSVFLPDTFFRSMLNGSLFMIDIPKEDRINRLVSEYAVFSKPELEKSILSIRLRMGTLQAKNALEALEESDFRQVASLLLDYYDKTYKTALERRPVHRQFRLEMPGGNPLENAGKLVEFASSLPL